MASWIGGAVRVCSSWTVASIGRNDTANVQPDRQQHPADHVPRPPDRRGSDPTPAYGTYATRRMSRETAPGFPDGRSPDAANAATAQPSANCTPTRAFAAAVTSSSPAPAGSRCRRPRTERRADGPGDVGFEAGEIDLSRRRSAKARPFARRRSARGRSGCRPRSGPDAGRAGTGRMPTSVDAATASVSPWVTSARMAWRPTTVPRTRPRARP